jgi:hypothetical protein
MAKRRNRNPNIPSETLERARQQAMGVTPASAPADPPPVENKPSEAAPRSRTARGTITTRRPSTLQPGQAGRRVRAVEEMTPEMVAELLANPTRVVTEEQLHQQYGYVLNDLRNMFVLAAALFAVLIALAVIFVR